MSRTPSREEELFADALAQPEGSRAAFLDTACGTNDALRAQVEALLVAHGAPANLLEPLVIPPPASSADEAPGEWIGRYKLLQKIGEGGCGVVWMAEQKEPVRRRVALKVIKAGMDTREVIARFAVERQALAIMDHAGIAKVLDAGATTAGRPFFVMELVRGVRITQYCDDHALSPAARLELFLQVCHAVQHAHQKGIIHRDLKPSNILVTLPEGGMGGVVKVIDFGIAKATQGRLVDGTLVTAFEQFLGTPVYMSPEQADTSGLDIDTRSDVYSLGVLLYELLAGGPPFDPKSLCSLSRDEIRRIIRDVDPPRPSARFASRELVERGHIAQLRATEPARLIALLKGDLDSIVMNALEKDRTRRYETAASFAVDITRYLNHEPVAARAPSKIYRVGKTMRRNRLAFAAAAAMTLTLLGATFVSIRQAVRAKQAEHVAAAEQARAVEARARADDLLAFMLGDLRTQLAKVGRLDVLESTGDKAMAYFASLDPAELSDAALVQHAKALRQIGEIRVEQRRSTDAIKSFEAAYQRAAALAARHPKDGEMLFERGQAEFWIGAEYRNRRDLAAARLWLTRYRETAVALTKLNPSDPRWRSELAHGHQVLAAIAVAAGDTEAARRGFLDELNVLTALLAGNPGDLELKARRAEADSWLGTIAERNGEYAEALARFADQVRQIEALARAEPDNARWKRKLADALSLHAGAFAITGQWDASLESRVRARALLDALVTGDPTNRARLQEALSVRLREARLLRAMNQPQRAAELVDDVFRRIESLGPNASTDRMLDAPLAITLRLRAEFLHLNGQHDAAAESIARAIHLCDTLLTQGGVSRGLLAESAQVRITAGALDWHRGQQDLAREHWRAAISLLEPQLPRARDWMILDVAARSFALLGRQGESRAIIERLNEFGYQPLDPWPEAPPITSLVRKNDNLQ